MASRKAGEKTLQSVSPAEFFANNREIAGFENTGKCLYTTVRELVENALDSAESIGALPEVHLSIEEMSEDELNKLTGIVKQERMDEELYKDFESEKDRKRRLAKEAKEAKKLEMKAAAAAASATGGAAIDGAENANAAATAAATAAAAPPQVKAEAAVPHTSTVGANDDLMPAEKSKARRDAEEGIYRIRCRDNGRGMPHAEIPNMLGKVLSSTNYCLRQTRGKYGLGAKMALIWSKMSTSLPIHVDSSEQKKDFMSRYTLDIDIKKNKPIVIHEEKLPLEQPWNGADIVVTIKGNWKAYGYRVRQYFRQLAIITPYAHFSFEFKALNEKNNFSRIYERRSEDVPPVPLETKYHPSAVDVTILRKLAEETKCKTLLQFFRQDFESIDNHIAKRLLQELGEGFDEKDRPSQLSDSQLLRINNLFREAKFEAPTGKTLSPAGEYNLRLGIMKEMQPVLSATHQGKPSVYQGHSFQVEAAVSIGGSEVKSGQVNVHRFANRIPLLFEPGSDVCTSVVNNFNWSYYKINPSASVSVYVSIVSTKVPFRGTSKEAISSESKEISDAVRDSIRECAKQLKSKIMKAEDAKDMRRRKKDLAIFVPNVASSIFSVVARMAGGEEGSTQKKRKATSVIASHLEEIMNGVRSKRVKEEMVAEGLRKFINTSNMKAENDYAERIGGGVLAKDRSDVYLACVKEPEDFGPPIYANAFGFRFLLPDVTHDIDDDLL